MTDDLDNESMTSVRREEVPISGLCRSYSLIISSAVNLTIPVHRQERPVSTGPHQCWSMDFVRDQLFDGRRFRTLTLVDNYSRECLEIEVGQSLKGFDVVDVMERIKQVRGLVPK